MTRCRFLLASVLAAIVSCGGSGLRTTVPTKPIPRGQGFLASVKLADITPPLHLSLFGHGPESRVATGVRLRLRCEAFVIAAQEELIAIVPCDLAAPSMLLQRRVAERLQAYGVPIDADQLFLIATHTHAGPAHYFEARRYSGTFSSAAPGFDEEVVDFLAGRIAGAVTEAFASLAPACLGWGYKDLRELRLTLNRSYVPFKRNRTPGNGHPDAFAPTAIAQHAEQQQKSDVAPLPNALSGPESATDPQLSVLRIDRRAGTAESCEGSKPLGVLAVFGMHPTGVPNTNELYHGDIFGFAVRTAEGQLSLPLGTEVDPLRKAWAAESAPPDEEHVIVGLANGIEGDVSPSVAPQSMMAARNHGRRLGHEIASLAQSVDTNALKANGTLKHLYWDLYFPGGRYGDKKDELLCGRPEIGVAMGGGAADGPTRLRVIPETNAGFRPDRPHGCHRYKLPLRIGPSSSPYDFPRVAPIGLIQIGDAVIATSPGEMTTMTGYRIREGIRARLAQAPERRVVMVGLTNQYLNYFTTREEYDLQYYEGASNLYGPNTERFLVRHFNMLSDLLEGRAFDNYGQPEVNAPAELHKDPDPIASRWPTEEAIAPRSPRPLVASPVARDGICGLDLELERLPLQFTSDREQFAVQIVEERDGQDVVVADDRGSGIEIREADDERWRVRWVPDLSDPDPRCDRKYRIAVRGTVSFETRPFRLVCRNGEVAGCQP